MKKSFISLKRSSYFPKTVLLYKKRNFCKEETTTGCI